MASGTQVTAIQIIRRAMRIVGALGVGEHPTADESADALENLAVLIASWNSDALMIYAEASTNYELVKGINRYTLGPTGNLPCIPDVVVDPVEPCPRPNQLKNVMLRNEGTDTPLKIIDRNSYMTIREKTFEGIPNRCWYNPTVPDSEIFIWPVPDKAYGMYIVYDYQTALASNINDVLDMPPQYYRALCFRLAVELAPEYGLQPDPSLMQSLMDAEEVVKKMNVKPLIMRSEVPYMTDINSWGRGTKG